jgi:alanine racemase
MESINPNVSLLSTRPAVMTVDLDRLAGNLARLRAHAAPAKVMAVVKANAYGHGLERCALHLEAAGADALGCAYLEEGVILRRAGVQIPILVFGGLLADQVKAYIGNDLDITASSLSKLEHVEQAAAAMKRRARVHLKIDTGMERLGVHHDTSGALLERVLSLKWCDVTGIFSHFARADEEDASFTRLQLERFLECARFFERHSLPPPLRHVANSAAVLRFPETHLDMVRPGISLYGVAPAPGVADPLGLEPVMSLATKVVYFKVVRAGSGVSYGHLWHAPRDTRVVTLPVGYGDGYPRALGNKAEVLVRGRRFPQVGAVCMDQLMVDIGAGEAYNGDEAVLVGAQGAERITVEELAARAGTIAYEILTGLNARIPRRYVGAESRETGVGSRE